MLVWEAPAKSEGDGTSAGQGLCSGSADAVGCNHPQSTQAKSVTFVGVGEMMSKCRNVETDAGKIWARSQMGCS